MRLEGSNKQEVESEEMRVSKKELEFQVHQGKYLEIKVQEREEI